MANKRMFVAILGVYYLSVSGVTEKGLGIVFLAGQLAGFLFEVPSGYISDKMGHKQALVASKVCFVLSSIAFLFANTIWFLIAGAIFMNLAWAFHSGTGVAFIHETLKGLGKDDQYAQIVGKMRSVGFAVPVIFMVTLPFLVPYGYQVPIAIGLLVDIVGLITAMMLVVPPVKQETIDEISATNFTQVVSEGYRIGYMPFALMGGLIFGLLISVSTFRAAYQEFLGVPIIYYGILFGIGRIGASILLAYSGRIRKWFTLKSYYAFQIITYGSIFVLFSVTSNWVAVVVLFIIMNALNHGLSEVGNSFHLKIMEKSKFKATLLSFRGIVRMLLSGLLGFGFGFIVESYSYTGAFTVFTILLVILMIPLYYHITQRSVWRNL